MSLPRGWVRRRPCLVNAGGAAFYGIIDARIRSCGKASASDALSQKTLFNPKRRRNKKDA
jgi:hypothetical protein